MTDFLGTETGSEFIEQIAALAARLKRKVRVLDLGGWHPFWLDVPDVEHVTIRDPKPKLSTRDTRFTYEVGEMDDISRCADIDFVYMGDRAFQRLSPPQVVELARQVVYVGKAGWIEVPRSFDRKTVRGLFPGCFVRTRRRWWGMATHHTVRWHPLTAFDGTRANPLDMRTRDVMMLP